MHGLAFLTLPGSADLAALPGRGALAVIGGTLLLYFSLMLSQAMESVTRAFYARGDVDLILSSPAPAERLFGGWVGSGAASILGMALVLAAPVINVVAWRGGGRWLAGYGVIAALATASVAISVITTVLLFATIGARRTRFVAQIIAAIVGASFVICVQFFAIL